MSTLLLPRATDDTSNSGNNNNNSQGTGYFFPFIITFSALFLILLSCGMNARRKLYARQLAAAAGAHGHGGDMGSAYLHPGNTNYRATGMGIHMGALPNGGGMRGITGFNGLGGPARFGLYLWEDSDRSRGEEYLRRVEVQQRVVVAEKPVMREVQVVECGPGVITSGASGSWKDILPLSVAQYSQSLTTPCPAPCPSAASQAGQGATTSTPARPRWLTSILPYNYRPRAAPAPTSPAPPPPPPASIPPPTASQNYDSADPCTQPQADPVRVSLLISMPVDPSLSQQEEDLSFFESREVQFGVCDVRIGTAIAEGECSRKSEESESTSERKWG